jgi:hypothetical protein
MKLQRLPKFHVFGSICYYHVPKELRTKLMTKGKKGLFLGFTNTSSLFGNIFQVDEACSYLSTHNELDLWHQKP